MKVISIFFSCDIIHENFLTTSYSNSLPTISYDQNPSCQFSYLVHNWNSVNIRPIVKTSTAKKLVRKFLKYKDTKGCVSSWTKGLIRYFGIIHDRALSSNLHFQKPDKIYEGEDIRIRPMRGSVLSSYKVMLNSQFFLSRKNYVPCITSEVTKIPIGWWIFSPLVYPSLIVCCICICCIVVCVWYRIFSLACIPRRWA